MTNHIKKEIDLLIKYSRSIKVFCASFFLVAQSFNLLNCSCHTLVLHMKICTPRYSSRHSFCLYNCCCIYYYNSLHKHTQNNLQHNVNGKLIWVLIEPNFLYSTRYNSNSTIHKTKLTLWFSLFVK